MPDLEKRLWVYCERPAKFEIPGCECGNNDPEWSEFRGHLWCARCEKDFVPAFWGVLDGPVLVQASELLGIYFDTIDLATGEIKPGPNGILHFSRKAANALAATT
jgi:hypothetical protein